MNTVKDTIPPADPPPYQQPGHRLTRSTDDKVVSGLSGGLGRYFGIDPVVFRIAFVVMALAGGSGVLLYLLGWLLIPDDRGGGALHRVGHERNKKLVAAVLAGIGVLLLTGELFDGDGGDVPIGLVLVGLGAYVLWSRRQQDDAGGPPIPPSSSPPLPPSGSGPDVTATPAAAPPPPVTTDTRPMAITTPPAPREPKPRSALVAVTLSSLAVLAGGLTLVGVSATTGLALALLLTGAALVVGAWRGRARWLIPLGLVLATSLAAVSLIDVPVRGGAGDIAHRPVALAEVRSPYRLAAGELLVDLRDLDLQGSTVTVVASVAAGSLRIVVPEGAAVEVDAHVSAGDLDVLGRFSEGLDVDRRVVENGREGGGRIILRADAGIGMVEVLRAAA